MRLFVVLILFVSSACFGGDAKLLKAMETAYRNCATKINYEAYKHVVDPMVRERLQKLIDFMNKPADGSDTQRIFSQYYLKKEPRASGFLGLGGPRTSYTVCKPPLYSRGAAAPNRGVSEAKVGASNCHTDSAMALENFFEDSLMTPLLQLRSKHKGISRGFRKGTAQVDFSGIVEFCGHAISVYKAPKLKNNQDQGFEKRIKELSLIVAREKKATNKSTVQDVPPPVQNPGNPAGEH